MDSELLSEIKELIGMQMYGTIVIINMLLVLYHIKLNDLKNNMIYGSEYKCHRIINETEVDEFEDQDIITLISKRKQQINSIYNI